MCAIGLRTPDAGSVRILGLDPARDPDAVRQRVEVQLQEAVLPNRMKVKEGIAVVAWGAAGRRPDGPSDAPARRGCGDQPDHR